MAARLNFSNKCSDFFAKKFASWRFVVPFLTVVSTWAFLNGCHYVHIDPELAFVNFFISIFTLFIDIVIIMNQRRQNEVDREKIAAILSLERNTIKEMKSVRETIDDLHRKIDKVLYALNCQSS